MNLRLISFALCPYVHRATTMLHEKGVAHEVTYIDLDDKPQWFKELSPRGKVPVLVADGTVVFESMVICELIDETHPPRLLPEEPFARARLRGWIEVTNDLFLAHYKMTTATTEQDLERAKQSFEAVLARLEAALAGKFFAGDEFGLVDCAAAPVMFRDQLLRARGLVRGEMSARAQEWATRLATRESVIRGVPADFEALFMEWMRGKGARLVAGKSDAA